MPEKPCILYCNCNYAQVVPPEVKTAVLKHLSDSGVAFDAAADLCEMSARRDPALKRMSQAGPVRIVACYPRAVKWLFGAAKSPLSQEKTQVLNMRVHSAKEIIDMLEGGGFEPNLAGDTTPNRAEAREPSSIDKAL